MVVVVGGAVTLRRVSDSVQSPPDSALRDGWQSGGAGAAHQSGPVLLLKGEARRQVVHQGPACRVAVLQRVLRRPGWVHFHVGLPGAQAVDGLGASEVDRGRQGALVTPLGGVQARVFAQVRHGETGEELRLLSAAIGRVSCRVGVETRMLFHYL